MVWNHNTTAVVVRLSAYSNAFPVLKKKGKAHTLTHTQAEQCWGDPTKSNGSQIGNGYYLQQLPAISCDFEARQLEAISKVMEGGCESNLFCPLLFTTWLMQATAVAAEWTNRNMTDSFTWLFTEPTCSLSYPTLVFHKDWPLRNSWSHISACGKGEHVAVSGFGGV